MPAVASTDALWVAVATPAGKAEAVWDDGSVIYDEADGSLTALNVSATEVLKRLRTGGPASLAALADELFGGEFQPEEWPQLEAILVQLQSLGLVSNSTP